MDLQELRHYVDESGYASEEAKVPTYEVKVPFECELQVGRYSEEHMDVHTELVL
jgi:hypothetical protein